MPSLSFSDFKIVCSIGSGSFSSAYLAIYKNNGRQVALKRLFWNNSPQRIIKEVKWLQCLSHPNITKLLGVFREREQVTLVFEYFEHIPFRKLFFSFTNEIIKDYFRNLFNSLVYVHSHKIIHRDVKPANFLYDPSAKKGCLIDFGLCEDDLHISGSKTAQKEPQNSYDLDLKYPERFQNRPRMIASRAGTRGFRAPEVLLSDWNQSCAIDMWSCGIILLSILSHRHPFFTAPDDLTALCEIARVFGTKKIIETGKCCGRSVSFPEECEPYDLRELCYRLNPSISELNLDDSVFDLLNRLLEPIPNIRITAKEALTHPYLRTL